MNVSLNKNNTTVARVKLLIGGEWVESQTTEWLDVVNPATQEVLAHYVPAFDKRFIGLRGTPEHTAATAKEFKVFVSKVPGSTPDNYTVDHTAGSYVFDKEGRIRLFVRHGGGPAPIVRDLRQLL